MGLSELVTFVGIETAGDVLGHALKHILSENRGLGGSRDGVQIDDSKIAFVPLEHIRPIAHGSQVVTDGQHARGLSASQYDWFWFAQ